MKQEIKDYTRTLYPEFVWLPEWVEYSETLSTVDEKAIYFRGVSQYGLNAVEPDFASDMMCYFNTAIRPEIDRQHERINRKKK